MALVNIYFCYLPTNTIGMFLFLFFFSFCVQLKFCMLHEFKVDLRLYYIFLNIKCKLYRLSD